jgi:hypothetical protein
MIIKGGKSEGDQWEGEKKGYWGETVHEYVQRQHNGTHQTLFKKGGEERRRIGI